MNGEIENINSLLHKTFNSFVVEGSKNASKIVEAWSSVLSKIKSVNQTENPNEGANLLDHSRVVDLKNGILLIEADHPGWISLLQFHKKFILKGMQMYAGDVEIKLLAFRLRGSNAEIQSSNNADVVRAKIEKRIEDEEKNLAESDFEPKNNQKTYKTEDLPPELAGIFADLKNSMLTNSKE